MSEEQTLLVTGASGQMGRRVIQLLLEKGAKHIIGTTRTPEKLADFASQGVIVRQADFEDPASLPAAFEGADRLLLISTDTFENRLSKQRNAVQAAAEAGVQHIVYTSIVRPDYDAPTIANASHWGTEQAMAVSGMGWTALRNNIYTDAQVGTLSRALQSGQLVKAAGDGRMAYVTREDCAQAAAAALTANSERQAYPEHHRA